MEYEDRITIATPEGVELELTLAGPGSRFTAALVDLLIRLALVAALAFPLVGLDAFTGVSAGGGIGLAFLSIASFLVIFGYDILFEVLASGRTPGKRWTGLRVVRVDGGPVGFLPSAVRNLLRLVDFLPTGYVIGCVSVLASARNQRLGDIAAGTIVVRERARPSRASWPVPDAARDRSPRWDTSAVTVEELVTVRRFLARRQELTGEARARLALELAERLRPKVAGVPESVEGESFLEQLAAAKAARG